MGRLTNSRNIKVLLKVFISYRDFSGMIIRVQSKVVVGKNEVHKKLINDFGVVCIVVGNDGHKHLMEE